MTTGKPKRFGNQQGEFYNYQKEIPVPERFIDGTKGNITRQNIERPPEDIAGLEQLPYGGLQGEDPPYETVEIPACTILDIDKSVKTLFDETIKFPTKYLKGLNKTFSLNKPRVIFAGGDRFAMAKKLTPLRSKDNLLILPAISIRRTGIESSLAVQGSRAISSATGEIIVKISPDNERDPFYQNLINKLGLKNIPSIPTSRRTTGGNKTDISTQKGMLLDPKLNDNTLEYLAIPAPTFVDLTYQVTLWTEDMGTMNLLLQTIMASKLPMDNAYVLTTDAGYWYVGYLGDQISMEDNFEDNSDQEKIVKTSFEMKVKAFLLQPNELTNMYPVKKYTTAVNFDFEVNFSSTKIYHKALIDQSGIKQNQDRFLLSDVDEISDPRPKTTEQNLYFEREVINNLTNKRELAYAEITEGKQSKETVYRASSINDVVELISLAQPVVKWSQFVQTTTPVVTGSTSPITSSPGNAPNIFAWYAADTVDTTGTSINRWLDKSGYGRHLTQSVVANKPTLVSTGQISYNNQPILSFDGGDSLAIDENVSFSLTQPFTVYLVAEQGPTATSFATYFDSSTSDRVILRKDTSNTVLNLFAGSTVTGNINQNTKQVTAVVYNGASTTVYNSASVSQFSGNTGTQTLGRPIIGIGQGNIYPFSGKMAELIFFSGSHSASDRLTVLDYLETKYWSPSSIPNMHAWWSARSVNIIDGLVSQINDLSGREKHLIQNTELRRPIYIPSVSGLNNQAALYFAGVQQMATAATHTIPSSFTIFFVLGNTVNRGMVVEHGTGSSLYVYSTGNAAIAKFSGASSHRTLQNPRTTWMTEYQQGSARYDSSAAPIMRGGVYGSITDLTPTSTDGSAITATITTTWYIGARSDFSLAHTGMISEVLVYERSLSLAEIAQVERYLNSIYGV
jgi:hypothetical protein